MRNLIITILVVVAVIGLFYSYEHRQAVAPTISPTPSTSVSVYENQFMKINIPSGWKTEQVQSNPAAVNITKGKYILYINTQASQASGIQGGRFAEIAKGAPSADAVVNEWPSGPCGEGVNRSAFASYHWEDLYVSAPNEMSYCRVPTNGKTVWYFSFLTGPKLGYFNYYHADTPPGLVVTMAYNSKEVNQLPIKDSAELTEMLKEMSAIAATLQIK